MTEQYQQPLLSKDDKTLKMFGLKGYKIRGLEIDNFGDGFNPNGIPITDDSAFELMKLSFRRYILQHIYLLFKWYYMCLDKLSSFYELIGQILLNVILQILLYTPDSRVRQFFQNRLFLYKSPMTLEEQKLKLQMLTEIPIEILFIITLTPFIREPPPRLPEPYLTSDKKLVVPTHREINKVMNLQLQYVEDSKIFKANEIFKKMMIISKMINYCHIAGVKYIKFHELTSELWNLPNVLQLLEFTKMECQEGYIKLINYNDNKKIFIIDVANKTINETNLQDFEGLTVVLVSLRQNLKTVIAEELIKNKLSLIHIDNLLLQRPNLIINCNSDNKQFINLMGFPIFPHEDDTDLEIYYDTQDLEFDFFWKCLNNWVA